MNELDPTDLVRRLNEEAFGPERHRPRGGAAHVGPSDTITCGGCWCGQSSDHDWPGKAEGYPHPRYPR